jgi:hypothetical protein
LALVAQELHPIKHQDSMEFHHDSAPTSEWVAAEVAQTLFLLARQAAQAVALAISQPQVQQEFRGRATRAEPVL